MARSGVRFMSDRARLAIFAALALMLLLALAAGFVALQAGAAVDRITRAIAPHAALSHGRVLVNAAGDLTVRDVRIVPVSNPRISLVARDARIVSPGPLWLLEATFGGGDTVPAADRFRVELDGVLVEGSGDLVPGMGFVGWTAGAPFEAAGCGAVTRWAAPDLVAMGLPSSGGQLTLDYRVEPGGLSQLEAVLDVPRSSRIAHRRTLKLKNPRAPLENGPADASLVELAWSVRDAGFVNARYRYCRDRLRLTRNLLVQRHLDAIAAWLEQRGLMVEPDVVDAYRRYASRGEDLAFVATPTAPTTFASLAKLDPAARSLVLDARLEASGREPAKFVLRPAQAIDFMGPPEPPAQALAETPAGLPAAPASASAGVPLAATPATAASTLATAVGAASASPGGATASAASAAPSDPPPAPPSAAPSATTPAPAAVASRPAVEPRAAASPDAARAPAPTLARATPAPSVASPRPAAALKLGRVRYTDLAGAVGRHVRIDTVFHSRRTGVLRVYNGEAVTLEVRERSGTMMITLPKATVVRAEVLDSRLVPEVPDAQAN